MAMNPRCIQAINQAAGRVLTQKQLDNIESRIRRTATSLARADPQKWAQLSADQRTMAAAQQAMADIHGEAAKKAQRTSLQVLKTAATEDRVTKQMALHKEGRSKGLVRDLDETENHVRAEQRLTMSKMLDTIETAKSGEGASVGRRVAMFLFDAENPVIARDLAREIFSNASGATGNRLARAGAKAWLDTIEGMRQRFNSAGGDIGKQDYGYLPQPHDQAKILRTKRDPWAVSMLPRLDRSRYLKEDGTRMNDGEVKDFLRNAWDTLSSGGTNKVAPGQFQGVGMRANKGSAHREIHFKDADAYLDYLRDYGSGSMWSAINGHVARLARDTTLIERYGPNPEHQMRLQLDLADRADNGIKRSFGAEPESYWNVVSGMANTAKHANMAMIAQGIRNGQTAGKLAGALLSSITDLGTYFVTSGFNKLGYWNALSNIALANTAGARRFANAHGMMAETLISDLNRWAGDHIQHGLTSKIANSTMKLSLLNAWTDSLRRAFSLTMMQGLSRMAEKDWAQISEFDRFRLESNGISQADWAHVRNAPRTNFNGTDLVTPESIATLNQAASTKYMAMILNESETAIVNPDLATRVMASGGGLQRGTFRGEIARSAMQFKSFPIAMITRHWGRILDTQSKLEGAPMIANPVAYAAMLGVSLTALGAVAYQTKQIVSGKDPIDMTGEHASKFWLRAFVQGGGAGILGDFLLTDPGQDQGGWASGAIKNIAGPAAGALFDLVGNLGVENIWQKAEGKPTHIGAEAVKWARSNLPYVNLWYAKSALDHALLHSLQENMSPGYLARMKQRANKDWSQQFWWEPGSGLPQRSPDIAHAIGQ